MPDRYKIHFTCNPLILLIEIWLQNSIRTMESSYKKKDFYGIFLISIWNFTHIKNFIAFFILYV